MIAYSTYIRKTILSRHCVYTLWILYSLFILPTIFLLGKHTVELIFTKKYQIYHINNYSFPRVQYCK